MQVAFPEKHVTNLQHENHEIYKYSMVLMFNWFFAVDYTAINKMWHVAARIPVS